MTCKEIDAAAVAKFLKSHDNFVILTHANPDGDTLGSGYALNEALLLLDKRSKVACADVLPKNFLWMEKPEEDFEPETVVAVDIADEKLTGALKETYGGKADICIDHHPSNVRYAKLLYLESNAAAACECIYKVITELNAEITPYIASCIYTGLATDTGCFKFSNTSPETHRIAADVMEKGADYDKINRTVFETKSRARIAIERMVLENIEFYFDNRCALVVVSQKMQNDADCDPGDIDGVTAIPRQIEGVFVGITVKEKPDGKYKTSVRTFEPFNAAEICSVFGGGGHERAGGCEFTCSLDEVKQKLIARVGEFMKNNTEKQ